MKLSPADAASALLRRRRARQNLLAYTQYTHPRFEVAQHHGIICTALEAVERGECNRLMIFCPPRHTKSELASRRFPSWYIGRHPDRQIIAASYNGDLASDFGRDVRNIIDSPEYSQLFPDCELAADSRAAARNAVRAKGSAAPLWSGKPPTPGVS